jgi:hypothetical protein
MLCIETAVREQHRAGNITAAASPSCRGHPFVSVHKRKHALSTVDEGGSCNIPCGEGRIERIEMPPHERKSQVPNRASRRLVVVEFSLADLVIYQVIHGRQFISSSPAAHEFREAIFVLLVVHEHFCSEHSLFPWQDSTQSLYMVIEYALRQHRWRKTRKSERRIEWPQRKPRKRRSSFSFKKKLWMSDSGMQRCIPEFFCGEEKKLELRFCFALKRTRMPDDKLQTL